MIDCFESGAECHPEPRRRATCAEACPTAKQVQRPLHTSWFDRLTMRGHCKPPDDITMLFDK